MCYVCCFNLWGVSSGDLFLAWHVFTLPQAFIHSCSQKMFPVHQLQPSSTNAHTIYIHIYIVQLYFLPTTLAQTYCRIALAYWMFSVVCIGHELSKEVLSRVYFHAVDWKHSVRKRQFCNMQTKNAEAKTCSKWRAEGGTCTMCTAIIVWWWKGPLKSTTTHDLRTSAFNLYILLICWWYTIFLILKSIGYIAPRHEAVTQSCNAQFKVFIFTATVIVSAIECCATVCGTHTCTEPPKIQKGQTIYVVHFSQNLLQSMFWNCWDKGHFGKCAGTNIYELQTLTPAHADYMFESHVFWIPEKSLILQYETASQIGNHLATQFKKGGLYFSVMEAAVHIPKLDKCLGHQLLNTSNITVMLFKMRSLSTGFICRNWCFAMRDFMQSSDTPI